MKRKDIDIANRYEIVTKFKIWTSASDLVKIYGISWKTVYNLVEKMNTFSNIEDKKECMKTRFRPKGKNKINESPFAQSNNKN